MSNRQYDDLTQRIASASPEVRKQIESLLEGATHVPPQFNNSYTVHKGPYNYQTGTGHSKQGDGVTDQSRQEGTGHTRQQGDGVIDQGRHWAWSVAIPGATFVLGGAVGASARSMYRKAPPVIQATILINFIHPQLIKNKPYCRNTS
jgi:hypothetical protein